MPAAEVGNSTRTDTVLGTFESVLSGVGKKLEHEVLVHLKEVYSTMTICLLIAIGGIAFTFALDLEKLHLSFTLAKFGLIFALHQTPPVKENERTRLNFLYGLSLLIGLTMSPLVKLVAVVSPALVFNGFVITWVVFATFSLAAMYGETTKFIGMGAFLSSAALVLLVTSFFSKYETLYPVILWAGLCVNIV